MRQLHYTGILILLFFKTYFLLSLFIACGFNTECRVQNHIPICSCKQGFTGDPFTQCFEIYQEPIPKQPSDPCIECGSNTDCNNGVCTCLPDYLGDPYSGCRPACVLNVECAPNKACINNKCKDPCVQICGTNAICTTINHVPTCSCPPEMSGDPFVSCRVIQRQPIDPCHPNSCGPNSLCRVHNGIAVCSCQPEMIGTPPSCRRECVVSADCDLQRSCTRNKCTDPCPGSKFTDIIIIEFTYVLLKVVLIFKKSFILSLFKYICDFEHHIQFFLNYLTNKKFFSPQNRIAEDTFSNLNLFYSIAACGQNSECKVINHNPICSCKPGFSGDPFVRCEHILREPEKPQNPCGPPSPCGPNSVCRVIGESPACSCQPNYIGKAPNCRPECTHSQECSSSLACINQKCSDPCGQGTCGFNARCTVINHTPVCTCETGYEGDPFRGCQYIQGKSLNYYNTYSRFLFYFLLWWLQKLYDWVNHSFASNHLINYCVFLT